jgi:hypothetical protein
MMAGSSTSAREPSTAPRRFLIVATNEGGGDIQPLLAIAAGLLARGHTVVGFGDASVPPKMAPLGISTIVAVPELALGAQYAAAAREAGHLPPERQTEWLRDRLITWAEKLAPVIERAAEEQCADVLVAALFGSGAVRLAAERRGLPWVAVNSTFYIGPNPPRPLETDFGTRTPLFRDFFAPTSIGRRSSCMPPTVSSTSASTGSHPTTTTWGRYSGIRPTIARATWRSRVPRGRW